MSSLKNIKVSNQMPIDLAKKIGINGVNEILLIFWTSFNDLLLENSKDIDLSSEEDDITQLWYMKLTKRWDSRNRATVIALNNLIPMNQYADSTLKIRKGVKSPTIDFCFRDWSTQNSYFGAECKNLYKNNTKKIVRYVETGVQNYVKGRYGSQSSENAIIGYVLSGDIPTIVGEIEKEIKKEPVIMNLTRMLAIAEPQYKSQHIRDLDKENITLYHLFFDFT